MLFWFSNQNLYFQSFTVKLSHCNAISQGQLLEMTINIIQFDNLYFSKGSYSSKEEQEDGETLRIEGQLE